MEHIQLSLFNDFVTAYETEKKGKEKQKPVTAEGDFKFTFLVNSSHIQHWRDCDKKTAQRRLARIRKVRGLRKGAWVSFYDVAEFEGWNSQILLDEMVTRRLRLKERHKDKT